MAEDKKTPEERIAALEAEINKLKKRGGMLSSADFRKNLIRKEVPKMKEFIRKRKWSQLPSEESFIIDPYNPLNLNPFSYDLSIGDEAFSCRLESNSSFKLGNERENAYNIEPSETVIVRTLEYIALPPCYSATAWPRFNFVREGIFQSMVKIDPTWYGQLGVALTNLSPAEYPIWKGKEFSTLILYELTQNTDIILYQPGEIFEPGNQMEICLSGIEADELVEKLREKALDGKCTIRDDKLIIEVALIRDDFKSLMGLYDSDGWKKAVEDAMKMKTMPALGIPDLNLILAKDPDGQKLTRENIAGLQCTPEALAKMAVERGKPFELIANMPKLTEEFAQGRVEVELNKEISKIILRIMAITVSLLGFISLVVAVIAIVAKYLQLEFPKELDANGTLIAAMIIICIPVVLAVLYVFSLLTSPKGMMKIKEQIARVDLAWRDEVRNIDDKYRDKLLDLEKRIRNIRLGTEKAEGPNTVKECWLTGLVKSIRGLPEYFKKK